MGLTDAVAAAYFVLLAAGLLACAAVLLGGAGPRRGPRP